MGRRELRSEEEYSHTGFHKANSRQYIPHDKNDIACRNKYLMMSGI